MERVTYEYVKGYIESFGYELLSKEYKNNYTKLKVKDVTGCEYKITWIQFKRSNNCNRYLNRKTVTYTDIKKYIESFGHTLISKTYKNNYTKLKLRSSTGCVFEATWKQFKLYPDYPNGFGKKAKRYEFVKRHIESYNYKLLSKKYIRNNDKLKIECTEGHTFRMGWSSFLQGERCPICYKESRETVYRYDYIKKQIESVSGYKLLSKKCKSATSKIVIMCNKGHTYSTTWHTFQCGSRCPICYRKSLRLSYEYVKEGVESVSGYTLLSTSYINSKSKLTVCCPVGHIYTTSWNEFYVGHRCRKCYHIRGRKKYTANDLLNITNYTYIIRKLSNRNYKKYHNQINPKNLDRGKHKYHIDHIYSVMEGLRNKIPAEIIANPYNLCMLWCKDNIIKHDKIAQTKQELYLGYYKFKVED